MIRCNYCGASGEGELEDVAKRMMNCNNCRVDMLSNGQFSGIFPRILRELQNKYTRDEIIDEYEKQAKPTR